MHSVAIPSRLSGLLAGAVGATLLVVASCSTVRTGPDGTARETIAALIAADNAGDVDRIASFYAEDAVLLPPGDLPAVGREAVRLRYAAGFARFELRVTLDEDGFRESGDLAFSHGSTRGEYVWRDGSSPTPFHDAYLMTLARDAAGRWKVAALMWSPLE